MSTFKKNIFYSYSTQAISVLCSFVGTILIARMLGADGQGQYSLYMNFLNFITLLLGLGLPSGLVHFIASGKIQRSQVMYVLLTLSGIMLGGGILLFWVVKKFIGLQLFLPPFILEQPAWTWILLAHTIFMLFSAFFQAILQAEQRFKQAGLAGVTGSILLLGLYAIRYFDKVPTNISPLQWIIVSMLIVLLIQIVLYKSLIYNLQADYYKLKSASWNLIQPMVAFSLMAFIANLIQFFNYKLDIWVINYFHHNSSLIGVYALAVSLSQLVWLLPSAVHGVLYSAISKQEDFAALILKTEKTAWYLLVYAVVISIIGYFLSIWLIPNWYGESFSEAPSVIFILIWGIIPISAGLALSAFFAGIQKVSINLKGSIIGLVICVLFDFLLIPKYGINGAAWASVLSYNATILFYVLVFRQYKKNYLKSIDANEL